MSISIGDAVLKMGVDKTEFDNAMKNMDTNIQSSMEKFKTGLRVGGAAMTAFGAAGLVMIQSTKKMNTELAMAGVNLNMTGKEMRNLALEITNVTFPLESVVATFDLLSRAGIKTAEDMRMVANDFDLLADAIGSTAEVVGETMIMGMKTFRLELTDSGKYLDNMTYLIKNTTLSIEDLNSCLGYTTAEAVDMGLTFEDTIAILGVLESKGVSGAVATRAWRSALSESEKTGKSMNEVLGVTNEEMAEFNRKIQEAEGITAKYAKMSEEQFTIMDKVKQKWSELTLSASGFLEPLEPILAGMTALGPMMILLSTSMGVAALKTGLHTIALIAHGIAMMATKIAIWAVTAAQWAWNAAMTANPIGLIILAVMALIAVIILIVKNWDIVREKTVEVWNAIVGFLRGIWDTIVGFFKENWALILAILFPAVGLPILIAQNWDAIKEYIQGLWDSVTAIISGWWENIKSFLARMNPWEWIKKGWEKLREGIGGVLKSIFGGSDVEEWVGGLKNYLGAQDLSAEGKAMFDSFGAGVQASLDNIQGAVAQNVTALGVTIGSGWGGLPAHVPKPGAEPSLSWFTPETMAISETVTTPHGPRVFTLGQSLMETFQQVGIHGWAEAMRRGALGYFGRFFEHPEYFKEPWMAEELLKWMTAVSVSYQHGGPIIEDTLLFGLKSMRPYARAEKGEYVTPVGGGRAINIFVELDGRIIAQAIGQPLVDEIRLRTGVRR